MKLSRTARWAVAALVGLAAAGATYARVAPIEPFLDVWTARQTRSETRAVWDVVMKNRGGETIESVAVEVVSGPAKVVALPRRDLPPGATWIVPVELTDWHTQKGRLRVVQTGRVERTYDVVIEETP
jgi:hypothetical protein